LNKPSKAVSITTFNGHKSARKVAAAVSKAAAGYREDLRKDAIVKASAFSRSQKSKKQFEKKSRK
jgi:hypothetical protein